MSEKKYRLPTSIIALGVTSFLTDIGSEMIFPLLPVFVASLGASATFLGLIEGLADATSSFLKLASGYVADHTQRKKPMVLFGYGVATIARPLMAFASAPWHVLTIRLTDRVGKGIRSTPRDMLIAGSAPRNKTGQAFGFHRAMDHAGAVVGPLVATALLGFGCSVRTVFMMAIIPGILAMIAVATVREPPLENQPPSIPTVQKSLPKSLRGYFAILLLFSLGNASDAFLLLRAKDLGVPIMALPLLWTTFHIAKLISVYWGGHWSDRVPRHNLIIAGWMLYAATYLTFGIATQTWHVWALFIIYGLYYGLTEPAERALVKDLAPIEVQGRAYGFYNFIIGVSAVPAGVLTGWIWQTWSPQAALATGAGLAAVASLSLIAWSKSFYPTTQ